MKTILNAMDDAKESAMRLGIAPRFAVLGEVKRKQLHEFFDEQEKLGHTVPTGHPVDYIEYGGMRVFFSAIPGIVVSATDPRQE